MSLEKVRRGIPFDKSLQVTYRWVIEEDGQASLGEVLTDDEVGGIKLEVTHLDPMQNGFSKDYGFPQARLLVERGFVNEFDLRGRWTESFRMLRRERQHNGLDEYDDPDGIAQEYADLEYDDFY